MFVRMRFFFFFFIEVALLWVIAISNVLWKVEQIVLTYWFVIGEKDYYERQLATLKSFEEVDSLVASDCIDEEDIEEQAQQERAMKISNYANIVLLLLKVVYVAMNLLL